MSKDPTRVRGTKEEGWRFIRAGETFFRGDEFWDEFQKEWGAITNRTVGLIMDADSVGRFRRRVK